MAFLNNTKYREIYESAKGGNVKAKEILQALRKMSSQGDLDRMVDDYYKIDTTEPLVEEMPTEIQNEVETEIETQVDPEDVKTYESVDISSILDGEFENLLDENEIEETSFGDYLKNKSRDGLRSRKNSDYFKAFDPEGRASYMTSKIDSYKSKFDNRLKGIDRKHRDMDKGLSMYSTSVNEMLDDGLEMDMSTAGKVYDDIIGNESMMSSMGRSWDEVDTAEVVEALRGLVAQYGKQNVIAALNTLKNDNNNYRDYQNNQIDSEISRYTKSVESLLK